MTTPTTNGKSKNVWNDFPASTEPRAYESEFTQEVSKYGKAQRELVEKLWSEYPELNGQDSGKRHDCSVSINGCIISKTVGDEFDITLSLLTTQDESAAIKLQDSAYNVFHHDLNPHAKLFTRKEGSEDPTGDGTLNPPKAVMVYLGYTRYHEPDETIAVKSAQCPEWQTKNEYKLVIPVKSGSESSG